MDAAPEPGRAGEGRAAPPARLPGWFKGWLLVCTLGLVVGIAWLRDERALQSRGANATATVVDWSVSSGRKSTRHVVRYRFQLPDDPTVYSHAEGFPSWRKDGWAEVDDAALWEATKRTRALNVLYLPDAPWTNRPSEAVPTARAWSLIIGDLFLYLLGFLLRWKARQDAWPTPPVPPSGPGKLLGRFERIRPRGGGTAP